MATPTRRCFPTDGKRYRVRQPKVAVTVAVAALCNGRADRDKTTHCPKFGQRVSARRCRDCLERGCTRRIC